ETSSMTLSMPKASSVRLCAASPAAIATVASMVIQPIVIHSSQNAWRTRSRRFRSRRFRSWRFGSWRFGSWRFGSWRFGSWRFSARDARATGWGVAPDPPAAQRGAPGWLVRAGFITPSDPGVGGEPTFVGPRLDLDGCVVDAEALLERAARLGQEMVVEAG